MVENVLGLTYLMKQKLVVVFYFKSFSKDLKCRLNLRSPSCHEIVDCTTCPNGRSPLVYITDNHYIYIN